MAVLVSYAVVARQPNGPRRLLGLLRMGMRCWRRRRGVCMVRHGGGGGGRRSHPHPHPRSVWVVRARLGVFRIVRVVVRGVQGRRRRPRPSVLVMRGGGRSRDVLGIGRWRYGGRVVGRAVAKRVIWFVNAASLPRCKCVRETNNPACGQQVIICTLKAGKGLLPAALAKGRFVAGALRHYSWRTCTWTLRKIRHGICWRKHMAYISGQRLVAVEDKRHNDWLARKQTHNGWSTECRERKGKGELRAKLACPV
jgi:hypothetical protein